MWTVPVVPTPSPHTAAEGAGGSTGPFQTSTDTSTTALDLLMDMTSGPYARNPNKATGPQSSEVPSMPTIATTTTIRLDREVPKGGI